MLIMDSDGSRILYPISSALSGGGFTAALTVIVLLLAVKAFFAACESAVTEFNDQKLKNLSEKDSRAAILMKITASPSSMMMTFSLFRVLSVIVVSVLSAAALFPPLYNRFSDMMSGLRENSPYAAAFLAALGALLVIIIPEWLVISAFTETMPKQLVRKNAEGFALRHCRAIKTLTAVLKPASALSSLITSAGLKLAGVPDAGKDTVTEEEILMMVDAGNETGVLEESQKEMINNIVEFGALTASDVMTHRTDIAAAELNSSLSDVVNTAISTGFSRIPVYEDTIDRIVGIINVKDMLCLIGSEDTSGFKLESIMRDVCYVPESGSCDDVFRELTSRHIGMAVVTDEYGGTAGIVTTEDLVEAIVGNIQDEYDNETEDIVEVSDGVYIVDGTADPYRTLGSIGINIPEEDDFDTVSGFVVSLLGGRIPENGEKPVAVWENAEFAALVTEDMAIRRLKVTIKRDEDEKTENDGENAASTERNGT